MERLKKIGLLCGMVAGVIAVIVEGQEILTGTNNSSKVDMEGSNH